MWTHVGFRTRAVPFNAHGTARTEKPPEDENSARRPKTAHACECLVVQRVKLFFSSYVPYYLHVGLQLPRRGHFPCFSTSPWQVEHLAQQWENPFYAEASLKGGNRFSPGLSKSVAPPLAASAPVRRRLATEAQASFWCITPEARRVIDDSKTATARATTANNISHKNDGA